MKLFIEVFVLNCASPKSLLQSVKILSIVKPPLWRWDCGIYAFKPFVLPPVLTLRLREAPCKHVCSAAPYPPATRLLLLWYRCLSLCLRFSHSFAFLTACMCPCPGERRAVPAQGVCTPDVPLLNSQGVQGMVA